MHQFGIEQGCRHGAGCIQIQCFAAAADTVDCQSFSCVAAGIRLINGIGIGANLRFYRGDDIGVCGLLRLHGGSLNAHWKKLQTQQQGKQRGKQMLSKSGQSKHGDILLKAYDIMI